MTLWDAMTLAMFVLKLLGLFNHGWLVVFSLQIAAAGLYGTLVVIKKFLE